MFSHPNTSQGSNESRSPPALEPGDEPAAATDEALLPCVYPGWLETERGHDWQMTGFLASDPMQRLLPGQIPGASARGEKQAIALRWR